MHHLRVHFPIAAAMFLLASANANVPLPNVPPPPRPIPGLRVIPDPITLSGPLPIVNDGFANDQDVPGSLNPLIKDLRSPTFAQREAATRALLRLPPARLPDIVTALIAEPDAEAIARLTQVAAHLFLKPRTSVRMQDSFLGVFLRRPNPLATSCMLGTKYKLEPIKLRPSDAESTMTVVITDLQPGFPAAQTLINGDRLVTFNDKGFPSDLPPDDHVHFPKRVSELWPAQLVPVTLLRDGKFLDMQVQLAGMPGNDTVTLSEYVDLRNLELTRFLASLKTGEQPPPALTPLPRALP